MKKYMILLLLIGVMPWIVGCTFMKMETEKIQDIEYQIIKKENQPAEIQFLIEENKESNMKMSYTDDGKEYIIIGYGIQDTSGYSVQVLEVYETENTLHVHTNLIGPAGNEAIVEVSSYPYIVICIEENEKPVVYE